MAQPTFALRVIPRGGPGGTAELDALAQESGLHPDTVRRLVRLGLLQSPFPRDAAARLARAGRLRRDLGLNYAGAILACELLDRIAALEGGRGRRSRGEVARRRGGPGATRRCRPAVRPRA